MRVLRIEAADGSGMYLGGATSRARVNMNEPYAHPMPYDDSGLELQAFKFLVEKRDDAFFGFNSEAQLRRWVYRDEWVQALHEVGCVLVEYDACEAYAGHTQVIFNKTTALRGAVKPLTSLIKE